MLKPWETHKQDSNPGRTGEFCSIHCCSATMIENLRASKFSFSWQYRILPHLLIETKVTIILFFVPLYAIFPSLHAIQDSHHPLADFQGYSLRQPSHNVVLLHCHFLVAEILKDTSNLKTWLLVLVFQL